MKVNATYCICGANENNGQNNGVMTKCEVCHQWYYFKCICQNNIQTKITRKTDVKFICGMNNCTFKEGFLMVKGTVQPLKQALPKPNCISHINVNVSRGKSLPTQITEAKESHEYKQDTSDSESDSAEIFLDAEGKSDSQYLGTSDETEIKRI